MTIGSYFKGWVDLVARFPRIEFDNVQGFVGQVLSVYYNESDNSAAGAIKVKIFNISDKLDDNAVATYAIPANINLIRYPLPGELVLLTPNVTDANSDGHILVTFYYTTVMSSASSISYNSNPFYLNYIPRDESTLRTSLRNFFKEDPKTRFEKELNDVNRFIKKRIIIQRPVLRPYEGDIILQSRFDSTIRLGSTNSNEENPWSEFGGLSGNPITIFSLRTNISNVTQNVVVTEDVDEDLSTVALCSSQKLPVKLGISRELKSFKHAYNVQAAIIETPISGSEEPTFLTSDWEAPQVNAFYTPDAGAAGAGTGASVPYTGPLQPGKFIPPVGGPNRITSYFYRSTGAWHGALDIGGPAGTPIYAVDDGIVVKTIWDRQSTPCPDSSITTKCGGGFGNYVIIYHPVTDLYTLYGHMIDLPLVRTKQTVKQGTQIGIMGNSGSSFGRHLHFEIELPVKRGQGNDPSLTPEQQFKKAVANHTYNKDNKLDILKTGLYQAKDGNLTSLA